MAVPITPVELIHCLRLRVETVYKVVYDHRCAFLCCLTDVGCEFPLYVLQILTIQ